MKRNRGSASEAKTRDNDDTTIQGDNTTETRDTMKRETDPDPPVSIKRQKSEEDAPIADTTGSTQSRATGSVARPALEERLMGYGLAIEEMQGSLQREGPIGSPRGSSTGDGRSDNDTVDRESVSDDPVREGDRPDSQSGSEEARRRRRERRRQGRSYSSGSSQLGPSLVDYIADLENIAKGIERQSPP